MNAQEIISRLAKARPCGSDAWIACCPAHKDKTPSLSIKVSDTGNILLKCHAGCETDSVCSAIGITLKDLMLDTDPKVSKTESVLVATYDYKDAFGKVLFQKLRYSPKTFKIRRPDLEHPGQWIMGLSPDTPRTLYRLPELLSALNDDRPVFFVEGEKDADTLAKNGFAGTCNPAGASEKWRDDYSAVFVGADLTIIADKDEPGRDFAQVVSKGINGTAKSIRVVEMPDRNGRKVKDVTDWFNAGGTPAEFDDFIINPPGDPTAQHWKLNEMLSYDVPKDPNAVIGWHDGRATRYLCRSYPAWLIGQSGIGKSSLGMQMCFFWAVNRPFVGIAPVRDGLRVLIVQNENDIGDCAEVTQGIVKGAKFSEQEFDLLQDRVKVIRCRGRTGKDFCLWLEREISVWRADIVYVDPLLRYAGIDVSRQDQCTKFLNDSLDPMLANSGVVLIGAHHTGKPKSKNDTKGQTIFDRAYSGIGSSELVNWARAVTIVEAMPDGNFELLLAKRGGRAWATHPCNPEDAASTIYLQHAKDRIFWVQIDPPPTPDRKRSDVTKGGRPNRVTEVASSNLHEFCQAMPPEGTGLRETCRRLEAHLSKNRVDISGGTTRRAVAALVANGKLAKSQETGLYVKGPDA